MSQYKQASFPIKTLQQRELEKAYYTKDKKKALHILILAEQSFSDGKKAVDGDILGSHSYSETEKQKILKNKHAEKESEFFKLQQKGFRFFGNSFESYKNILLVDIYVTDIIKNAVHSEPNSLEHQIYNLLDKMAEVHIEVLRDPFLDELFIDEYNSYIVDKLQEHIKTIAKHNYKPIEGTIKKITTRPLKWNADKNAFGTLFGMLYQAGIISGEKEDIIQGLSAMFDGLNENTLMDDLSFKHNYDEETEAILKIWISALTKQKNALHKHKGLTKQK